MVRSLLDDNLEEHMKKEYKKPTMTVIELDPTMILAGSPAEEENLRMRNDYSVREEDII